MPSTRRTYLSTVGSLCIAGLAGCQSVLSSSRDAPDHTMAITNPRLPDELPVSFSGRVVRDVGEPNPPKVELSLSVDTEDAVSFGAVAPFSSPELPAYDGDSTVMVIPDYGPNEFHAIQPTDPAVKSFVPDSRDGCWTARDDAAILYQMAGARGRTATREYFVLNDPTNTGCFPATRYRATDTITVGFRESNDGRTFEWGFDVRFDPQ